MLARTCPDFRNPNDVDIDAFIMKFKKLRDQRAIKAGRFDGDSRTNNRPEPPLSNPFLPG